MDNSNKQTEQPAIIAPGSSTPPVPSDPDSVGSPSAMPVLPQPPKKNKRRLIVGLIIAFLLIAGAAAYFMLFTTKEDELPVQTSQNVSEQPGEDESAEESGLKTTEYTTALEHKSTVSIEHPSDWIIESQSTEVGDGFTLNALAIGPPTGPYLHIYDRDGIGGSCESNTDTYTLAKRLATRTDGLFFKEFDVPSIPSLNGILLIEQEGKEWSVAAHDAQQVGESLTNTCNLPSWSSVGASGIFVMISNVLDRSGAADAQRLGWDDIKDNTDFVKMLESITAIDKSLQN